MYDVVPTVAQPFHDTFGNAHVGEKPQLRVLSGVDLFLSQPGGVPKGLFDVRCFEIGIVCKHFINCRAMGYLSDDDRYRNSHSSYAGAPPHNLWIEGNTVKHSEFLDLAAGHGHLSMAKTQAFPRSAVLQIG